MKKILFSALVIAAAITGCDCKHGYGPDNCKDTWASNYVGTWQGSTTCGVAGQTGLSTITEESATSIRIDGLIFAQLTDWNQFTIPTQQLNGATIAGQGGIREHVETSTTGAVLFRTQQLWFTFTATQNNQSAECSAEFDM